MENMTVEDIKNATIYLETKDGDFLVGCSDNTYMLCMVCSFVTFTKLDKETMESNDLKISTFGDILNKKL